MAHGSQVMNVEIALSDVDRGVYESLSMQMGQHKSESGEYLVARIIAYALEYTEGIAFTSGLASSADPAMWVRDLTGQLQAWIEVGTPSGPRLHKASKASDRVAVYCHKDPAGWLRGLAREKVHSPDTIALITMQPSVIRELSNALDRRSEWAISRVDGTVYIDVADESWVLPMTRQDWPTS